jgi:hypothetical protein
VPVEHVTATRRWRYGPIIASEGLALFHFVSREALQRHRHIFDRRMFIPIGHSSGGMSADFVACPLLDPGTGRARTERVPPGVIWLNAWVGDPKSPYPPGQPLARRDCGMLAWWAGRRSEEQRPLLPQASPDRLDVFQQTHLDQMGMNGDCAGFVILHWPCIGRDPQDRATSPLRDVLDPQLAQLADPCPRGAARGVPVTLDRAGLERGWCVRAIRQAHVTATAQPAVSPLIR